ncbi:POP1-domain-containing protein [Fomitiporia mediterranea MF3/22]|uniref:POP1-domain-containing protein n=1 Tax=Fomitiporia mediterranea (strain MF3/22) TaxID=694068 RepID=UPI0004409953|nr:POP1-domain-containing protein [Fomitiporia mediterranea MF3/22]EJC98842.1 POP1-domain-containing protein [Fomitiporia mediterranea MF3/22]
MEGLPSTIDVEKFAEARAFEINAMQNAMDNVAAIGTQRVWQTLPRHLRRRAASHDVRRVPARLRQKARSEMDTPAKPASKKKLSKRGKEKTITKTEKFLKRQKDKTWLETHIWHAKRMHMENMWGYRLAQTPTEKSFRPSHRASLHGCILHDASYEAIIELKGPEATLKEILASCSDPQSVGPGAIRFSNGSRICHTHMYKPKSYPFDLIGPIEVLWKADPNASSSPSTSQSQASATQKDKQRQTSSQEVRVRTLWIRCHPLIYDEVMSTIKYSVQARLQMAQNSGNEDVEIEMADLRDQFNIFELVGPKSSQVIHGALTPVKDESRDEFKKLWKALGQLQTAGSAPRGMVVGFKVLDPRLNFPPKNTKVAIDDKSNVPVGFWPTAKLAASDMWNDDFRAKLSKPRFKKKDIDARKSKHLIPGSKLNPLRQDNRIPVLLIQRSIESHGISTPSSSLPSSSQTSSSSSSRPLHGWTLIIPKGWGMPFFSSLTHTGTRVAGQREIPTQRFEAGCTAFPFDYPCTEAYDMSVGERAKEERERWERKPPAKRINWEKVGTESPWIPDWEGLLGLRRKTKINEEDVEGDLVPTQRDTMDVDLPDKTQSPKEAIEDDGTSDDIHPWLFRGPEAPSIDDSLLRSAIVGIRLSVPLSGSPENNAVIYKVDDEEVKKWRELVEDKDGKSDFRETELSDLKPSKDLIIGYVTSGHYSLSIGRGQAVGALSLTSYLEIKEQLHRLGKVNSLPLVKFRNKHSAICRAAFVELAS